MMKYLTVLATGICITLPNLALAKPVYLSCEIPVDDKIAAFEVTADEEAGTVSYLVVSSGFTKTMPGAFQADKVVFGDKGGSFTIDRTNLAFTRTITMINSSDHGQCKIIEAPKRAF